MHGECSVFVLAIVPGQRFFLSPSFSVGVYLLSLLNILFLLIEETNRRINGTWKFNIYVHTHTQLRRHKYVNRQEKMHQQKQRRSTFVQFRKSNFHLLCVARHLFRHNVHECRINELTRLLLWRHRELFCIFFFPFVYSFGTSNDRINSEIYRHGHGSAYWLSDMSGTDSMILGKYLRRHWFVCRRRGCCASDAMEQRQRQLTNQTTEFVAVRPPSDWINRNHNCAPIKYGKHELIFGKHMSRLRGRCATHHPFWIGNRICEWDRRQTEREGGGRGKGRRMEIKRDYEELMASTWAANSNIGIGIGSRTTAMPKPAFHLKIFA